MGRGRFKYRKSSTGLEKYVSGSRHDKNANLELREGVLFESQKVIFTISKVHGLNEGDIILDGCERFRVEGTMENNVNTQTQVDLICETEIGIEDE